MVLWSWTRFHANLIAQQTTKLAASLGTWKIRDEAANLDVSSHPQLEV